MLTRLRKQQGNRATLTFKMPINAASRVAVDAETERVRTCVIPIIGGKDGSPYLVGSAVALSFHGRKCLATAFHVLSNNEGSPLYFFGAGGSAYPFGGTFEISETHDLAVVALDPSEVESLSHVPFIAEDQFGSVARPDGWFYASVVGYPLSASKRRDKLTLDTPMDVYSNRAREEFGGFISVIFDKKEGAGGESGHVKARDPIGKSGGAIFGIPLLGLNGVQPWARAKLVGIPTDWRRSERRILGASVAALIPLLEKITQSD